MITQSLANRNLFFSINDYYEKFLNKMDRRIVIFAICWFAAVVILFYTYRKLCLKDEQKVNELIKKRAEIEPEIGEEDLKNPADYKPIRKNDRILYLKDFEAAEKTDRLWVTIHGKVYDLSEFKDDHPGGEACLVEFQGLDATEEFENVGHSQEAHEMMKNYYIGVEESIN